ncbi:MAG: hypothetical protein KAJ91_03310 [Candidatus Aenigmarchaeota archaeon]|nr:hypothetical protein [Candidatus Aenigmarchaeota archaeon]MCK5333079.1 hypothetical protein [Candidatus Aenigmarchaeota archaeon]
MAERINESEVNRLRQIVGMDTQTVPKKDNCVEERRKEAFFSEPEPASADTTLFVKIDDHELVSNELSKSRLDIKAMANTIELLGKAEKLKAEAVARMEENLNILDAKIKDIEPRLQAPEGLSRGERAPSGTNAYSDSLSDLKTELSRIKTELKDTGA